MRLSSLTLISALIVAGFAAPITHAQTDTALEQNTRLDVILQAYRDLDQGAIIAVAHRGCWTHAPENSVASMDDCVDLGVDAVEIDVRLTRDGELVVFHDRRLNRMTPLEGNVDEVTLEELRAVYLYERDGSPAPQYGHALLSDQKVATLEEILEAARGRLMINLEIKTSPNFDFAATFEASKALVERMGMEDHIFWKIPAPRRGGAQAEQRADEIANQLDLAGLSDVMPILWQSPRSLTQQLEDYEGHAVTSFELVSDEPGFYQRDETGLIIGAHTHRYMGVAVRPQWSGGYSDERSLQDPETGWGQLIDLGFDVLMTDRPEQLMEYLCTAHRARRALACP